MQMENIKNNLCKILYVATITLLIYFTFKYLLEIILPFIIAIIIAELTRKTIDSLQKRTKIPRQICSIITVTFALLILLSVLFFGMYQLYAAAQVAVEKLPNAIKSVQEWAREFSKLFAAFNANIPPSLSQAISEAPGTLLSELMAKTTAFLAGTAGQLPASFITIIVTVIASYIISADYYKLTSFISQTLSKKNFSKLMQTRSVIIEKTVMISKGYGILLSITFAELTIAFLVLGVNQAVVIAALTALVDILPLFGVGTVLLPWAIFEMFKHNFFLGIGLIVVYLAVSLTRNFIEPKIIGAKIKLSPLTVLICMFIGYKVFGIAGLIFTPFAASIAKELIKRNVI